MKYTSYALRTQAVALVLLGLHGFPINCEPRTLQGLYAGWIGHGSMQDELVLDVFMRLLWRSLQSHLETANSDSSVCGDGAGSGTGNGATGGLGCSSGVMVTMEYHEGGVNFLGNQAMVNKAVAARDSVNYSRLDFTVVGGGSLLEPVGNFYGLACRNSRAANVPIYIHGAGTQVPFNASIGYTNDALTCVEAPVFGGVRGPLTRQFVHDLSADATAKQPDLRYRNPAQLDVIGDSGLLAGLIFPRVTGPVVELLDQQQPPSAGTVCLGGLIELPSTNLSVAIQAWATKYTVLLLPVDLLHAHMMEQARNAALQANPGLRGRVLINRLVTNYGVWLSLLDRCDVMLTSRLYAVIVSAAALTPFYVFSENRRSQLKLRDFTLAAFGEELDGFRLSSSFQGTLDEVSAVVEQARSWNVRRYNSTFRAGVFKSLAMHRDALMKFWSHILPAERAKGFMTARISVQASLDHAMLSVALKP